MPVKKKVCFFIVLLLLSTLTCSVGALPDTIVSFRGDGVTIDLTYPEEAHPAESILHNVTITANVNLTLQNFTLVIYAPTISGLQEATSLSLGSRDMIENQSRIEEIRFTLPQDANGTLNCLVYVQTNQTVDAMSYNFYTTHVSELTFTEMQSLYNEMLGNYTALQADYEALMNEYNDLLINYSSLLANYTTLLSEHNQLTANYNSKVAAYALLSTQYDTLSNDYEALNANYRSKITDLNALQADYNELNSTRNSLQASYDTLQAIYSAINQTYTEMQSELADLQNRFNDSEGAQNSYRTVMLIFVVAVAALVVFIVYMKRKQQEPYVVIRKETVSMNHDEKSEEPS